MTAESWLRLDPFINIQLTHIRLVGISKEPITYHFLLIGSRKTISNNSFWSTHINHHISSPATILVSSFKVLFITTITSHQMTITINFITHFKIHRLSPSHQRKYGIVRTTIDTGLSPSLKPYLPSDGDRNTLS